MVLVNPEDSYDTAWRWLGENGVGLLNLLDPGGSIYRSYGGIPDAYAPFPLQVVVDQEGVVRYLSGQNDTAAVRAAIDALLE